MVRGITFEIGILVDVIDERLSGLWSIGAIVVMDIYTSAILVALVPILLRALDYWHCLRI